MIEPVSEAVELLIARLRGPAIEAALRLIAGAFRRDGERLEIGRRPLFSIPTRPILIALIRALATQEPTNGK